MTTPSPRLLPSPADTLHFRDYEPKFLGPMPVWDFINEFFPISLGSISTEMELNKNGVECNKISFASNPDSLNKEEDTYEGLVSTTWSILSF
jgi:hypothetical protein